MGEFLRLLESINSNDHAHFIKKGWHQTGPASYEHKENGGMAGFHKGKWHVEASNGTRRRVVSTAKEAAAHQGYDEPDDEE